MSGTCLLRVHNLVPEQSLPVSRQDLLEGVTPKSCRNQTRQPVFAELSPISPLVRWNRHTNCMIITKYALSQYCQCASPLLSLHFQVKRLSRLMNLARILNHGSRNLELSLGPVKPVPFDDSACKMTTSATSLSTPSYLATLSQTCSLIISAAADVSTKKTFSKLL